MSTALRDTLITAGKTYARKRKEALTNSDLTETGKQKALEEAQKEFDAVAQSVTKSVHDASTKLPGKPKKKEQESAADALLELKEELSVSTDPSMTVLNLVMRSDQQITGVIASDEGRKLIQKAMEKHGLVGQEAERTVTQLQTAAEKRNGQQQPLKPVTNDDVDAAELSKESRFWSTVLPTTITDIEQAIERGGVIVIPELGSDPIEVRLDGSEK